MFQVKENGVFEKEQDVEVLIDVSKIEGKRNKVIGYFV